MMRGLLVILISVIFATMALPAFAIFDLKLYCVLRSDAEAVLLHDKGYHSFGSGTLVELTLHHVGDNVGMPITANFGNDDQSTIYSVAKDTDPAPMNLDGNPADLIEFRNVLASEADPHVLTWTHFNKISVEDSQQIKMECSHFKSLRWKVKWWF
jgi:hypothetical protein